MSDKPPEESSQEQILHSLERSKPSFRWLWWALAIAALAAVNAAMRGAS